MAVVVRCNSAAGRCRCSQSQWVPAISKSNRERIRPPRCRKTGTDLSALAATAGMDSHAFRRLFPVLGGFYRQCHYPPHLRLRRAGLLDANADGPVNKNRLAGPTRWQPLCLRQAIGDLLGENFERQGDRCKGLVAKPTFALYAACGLEAKIRPRSGKLQLGYFAALNGLHRVFEFNTK